MKIVTVKICLSFQTFALPIEMQEDEINFYVILFVVLGVVGFIGNLMQVRKV